MVKTALGNVSIIPQPKGPSPQADEARKVYVELGSNRSFTKAAEELQHLYPERYRGKVATLERHLKEWSTRWGWQEAAAVFDQEQERLFYEHQRAAIQDMNKEQADAWKEVGKLTARQMQRMSVTDTFKLSVYTVEVDRWRRECEDLLRQNPNVRLPSCPEKPALFFTGQFIPAAAKMATDAERVARGAASEISQQNLITSSGDALTPGQAEDHKEALRAKLFDMLARHEAMGDTVLPGMGPGNTPPGAGSTSMNGMNAGNTVDADPDPTPDTPSAPATPRHDGTTGGV